MAEHTENMLVDVAPTSLDNGPPLPLILDPDLLDDGGTGRRRRAARSLRVVAQGVMRYVRAFDCHGCKVRSKDLCDSIGIPMRRLYDVMHAAERLGWATRAPSHYEFSSQFLLFFDAFRQKPPAAMMLNPRTIGDATHVLMYLLCTFGCISLPTDNPYIEHSRRIYDALLVLVGFGVLYKEDKHLYRAAAFSVV